MAAARNQHRPTFFWQGTMIVLPVAVLAVASLISLRQDERAAELDARNRAVENARSLGRAMSVFVSEEIGRFLELQNVWMVGLRVASQPSASTVFPDAKLQADMEKWKRDYPGLGIADLATPEGEILADGRQIAPPDLSTAPRPPRWYSELSPGQRNLWESLREAGSEPEIRKRLGAFLQSKPPAEARQAANCLHSPAEEVASHSTALPSETGLSFEEIACYQLLTKTNAQLTGGLLQSVWWQVMEHSSFASPALMQAAGQLTNKAGADLQRKFSRMREFWRDDSEARKWLGPLRQPTGLAGKQHQSWAQWIFGADSQALAFIEPCTFANMGTDADGRAFSGNGFEIMFVPRKVVEAIFDRALVENRIFIPGYASAAVTVAGNPFVSLYNHGLQKDKIFLVSAPPKPGGSVLSLDEILEQQHWQSLASDTERISARMTLDAANFEVQFYLTSREQMLSAERQRAGLFGMLILGAALTAVAGLLAAWRAFRRQLQLNEQKSNFVSSVSHELRAPIASVRLMAENLERGKVPEAARQGEYFRFIVQECRRLSSLIENVLDFSRIEQGRKQYEFEPANMVALAENTVKLMEPYAAEKGVVLKLETLNAQPSAFKIEANVDGRAIQQALVNLIDNAVKHSPKGEMVTVGIEFRDSALELSVTDHGPGIPPAEREKIFERFYRLGSELRRETQGVGIGLSVVKHIVEAHGGQVRVESDIGKGSRFVIELPVQRGGNSITNDI